MTKFKRIAALVISFALIFTVLSTSTVTADTQDTNQQHQLTNQTQAAEDKEYLDSVREFIKQKYSGLIPEEEMNKATNLKDIFATLDDYSTFLTEEEFESMRNTLSGSVEGIGILTYKEDKAKYVAVEKVYKNSPAWKSGVMSGDQIAEVDGKPVSGLTLEEVISKIKGASGTKVKLGLIRQGVKNKVTVEVQRAQIDIPTVHYEIRGINGYILIDSFSTNTYRGVKEALKYFDSKKITRVILDLRNNPGGYLEQAISVAQEFVPKGLITKLDYKDESVQDESFYSSRISLKYKLAVLVNENSASAAEIVTGAIKDTKAGVVIGTKTFGKAKVQSFFPLLSKGAYETFNKDNQIKKVDAFDFEYLPEDAELAGWAKMTIGLYYTPNGDCIDLKGIEPNVKVAEKYSTDNVPVSLLENLSVTVKPRLGTKYSDVFYAEYILKLLNYNVDKPDMTLDKKTVAAIAKFQKDNKVYSYGVLDFTTQKLLNNKLGVMKQTKDPVYSMGAKLIK